MPKYLFTGSYTQEGVQGLLKDGGTRRRQVVEKLAKSLGGNLETFYFAFGGDDMVAIADLPDDAAAAVVSLSGAATGTVRLNTTVLLTPETMDEATKKRVDYTPPGG